MYYEICGDLINGYMSLSSHKLSNNMRDLTIISLLLMPPTLIAGIYGMNFENMPELHWHYGYYAVMTGMAVLAISSWLWAWRKWMQ